MTQFGKRLIKGLEEAVAVAKGEARPAKIYRRVGVAKRNRGGALAAIRETSHGLAQAGVLGKQTMAAFDGLCLTPVERLSAVQIRRIRAREKASQAVFARYLNVTTGLISQ